MSSLERRRHVRTPFNEAVRISWQDSSGLTRVVKGKARDRSQGGLGVESNQAVEARTVVQVQAGSSRALGLASVRYCTRKRTGFVLGLEFSAGFRWRDWLALSGD
jgi:hypothetical protein